MNASASSLALAADRFCFLAAREILDAGAGANSLLRVLGDVAADEPRDRGEVARFGDAGQYVLRTAITEADRLACWRLVQEEYKRHGYADPGESEYRYSLHDALPDTGTWMVEADGGLIATVSVFPDSPLGLPADAIYKTELDALRSEGRAPAEVGRLTVDHRHANDKAVLIQLFEVLWLYAYGRLDSTDLIITVNPSHEQFYRRMLYFELIGGEKELGSVCGAPAVLLRLDLGLVRQITQARHGRCVMPPVPGVARTFYRYFSDEAEENRKIQRLKDHGRPPAQAFIRRHFVESRPLIPSLPSPLRYFFRACYPACGLARGWARISGSAGAGRGGQ